MRICSVCGTDNTPRWFGVRVKTLLCRACYYKKRMARIRAKNKPKIYSMWGE